MTGRLHPRYHSLHAIFLHQILNQCLISSEYCGAAEPPVRTDEATPTCITLLLGLCGIQSVDFSHRNVFGRISTLDVNLIGVVYDP